MNHEHKNDTSNTGIRLLVTMVLNFAITGAEIVGGILSGSISLISDALHNFSDGLAIAISYAALRLTRKPRSAHYTFGLKRAEILAAIINAAMLIVICFFLFKEAYMRLMEPRPVAGGLMMLVAGIGLFANILGTVLLHRGSGENLNIRSAYLHLFSDAVSSLAVVVGGIAIYFWSVYWLDPLLTVLISIYILIKSYQIVVEAVDVIMMGSPRNIAMERIKAELEGIDGVRNIHHIHLWRMGSDDIHFEAHVDVEDMHISQTNIILETVEERLERLFAINHVTVQFECNQCATDAAGWESRLGDGKGNDDC